MSATHGKTHRLYAGGHNLSRFFRAFQTDESVSDSDTTVFVDRARRYQPGKSEDAASGDGILHADPARTRDIMRDAMGTEGSIVVSLPVDEAGQIGFALPAFQAKWAMGFPMDDIVDVQAEWKSQGGATHPVCVLDAAERTGAATGVSVDLGAGTHDVTVIAQLLSLAGFASVTMKVQHRALETDAWVDIAALTTAALTAHDFATLTAAAVKRYVRCIATPAGVGPGTFEPSLVIATT